MLGAVIAGGRSSRFGSDKRLALVEGTALIDHAVAALWPFVGQVVVAGPPWRDLPCVEDVPLPGLGPLGGLAGALGWAEARDWESVVTIGCDMPDVPAELMAKIAALCSSFCADAPVLGHWPAALAGPLADHLRRGGDRSVRRWAASVGAAAIPAPAPLANINTPADLPA